MRRLSFLATALALLGVLVGCSTSKLAAPNLPPETTLFVQFDESNGVPHTVLYEVTLHWLGADPDGFVSAYDVRFIDPARPADTLWVRTSRTDSTIIVPTPNGAATPRFEVRAIDDAGAPDPSPASQDFSFRNAAPTIRITNPLRTIDSTYASVTINWLGVDPDGDANRLKTRVWLDGNEAGGRLVSGFALTVPSADFLQGGKYRAGPRRLYVQAIDPGGRASTVDSMMWYVRRPCADTTRARGRVLLIDDVPVTTTAAALIDSLWWNGVTRAFPPGSTSLLRLELTQPFRSTEDLRQTLDQFEIVVWYRGAQTLTGVNALLRDRQDAIAWYLEHGGSAVLEGLNLVEGLEIAGALRPGFARDYLACDSIRSHSTRLGDEIPEQWAINSGSVLNSSLYASTLRVNQTFVGLRAFAVRDTNDVALWARTGNLAQLTTEDLAVAVRAVQPTGGHAIAITIPLRGANGGNAGDASTFLSRVFSTLPARP